MNRNKLPYFLAIFMVAVIYAPLSHAQELDVPQEQGSPLRSPSSLFELRRDPSVALAKEELPRDNE